MINEMFGELGKNPSPRSRRVVGSNPIWGSDRICDLDFESGTSLSEPTEEQLTDRMDTNNFCDGQGATYELN